MGGENPAARIWKNTNRLADQIRTEAQLVVQGLKSPGQIKRELMHDYDVSFHQAERLIDTEISYVLNKANLEQYRRYGVGKVTIVNLDVNTCEKCKALEGQVFRIEDAPVLPIHPRCHCSYCVPAEGDDAEVTASGSDLASVYADAGIEGYERVPAGDGRKLTFTMAEIRSEPEVLQGRTSGTMQDSAAAAVSATTAKAETETAKTLENKGVSGVSVLQGDAGSGIINPESPPMLMDEESVRSWIASNVCSKELRIGRQRVHIPGTKEHKDNAAKYTRRGEFGPSTLSITEAEAFELGLKFMGKGRVNIKKGGWDGTETITENEQIVGDVIDNRSGVESKISVFKIHYSKAGFHIVSDYPSKKRKG